MKPVTIASVRAHGVRQLLVYCNGKREGDWPGSADRAGSGLGSFPPSRDPAHCPASGIRSGAGQGVRPHVPLVRARSLDPVEVHEHVADGSLHVTVPESAQGFFCPRHDGQLRCDVLEKFPPKPSRHEAGDVEDRLQLLVGERARHHGLGG